MEVKYVQLTKATYTARDETICRVSFGGNHNTNRFYRFPAGLLTGLRDWSTYVKQIIILFKDK
jgi:hypothetical protein